MRYSDMIKGPGDNGTTKMFFGTEVDKGVEVIGLVSKIDTFHASLGVARCHIPSCFNGVFDNISRHLFDIMGYIMSGEQTITEKQETFRNGLVTDDMVRFIDGCAQSFAAFLDDVTNGQTDWVVYGRSRNKSEAFLDQACTLCREAEYKLLKYIQFNPVGQQYVNDSNLKIYMNRLSKVLYLLARIAVIQKYGMIVDNVQEMEQFKERQDKLDKILEKVLK